MIKTKYKILYLSLSGSEERGEGEEWKPSSSLCHYVIITEINAQKSTQLFTSRWLNIKPWKQNHKQKLLPMKHYCYNRIHNTEFYNIRQDLIPVWGSLRRLHSLHWTEKDKTTVFDRLDALCVAQACNRSHTVFFHLFSIFFKLRSSLISVTMKWLKGKKSQVQALSIWVSSHIWFPFLPTRIHATLNLAQQGSLIVISLSHLYNHSTKAKD